MRESQGQSPGSASRQRPASSTRWSPLLQRRITRRAWLGASARAGVGAAGLALVGCGADDDEEAADQFDQAGDQSDAQTDQGDQAQAEAPDGDPSAADPPDAPPTDPVEGGIAQLFGVTEEHDRWDPHRSRFRQTQSYFSLIYNRLVRPASVSEGVLEPDLASLPEQPDAETYLFSIRPEARFWDDDLTAGRAFTASDASFNILRQQNAIDAAGNPDLLFFRRDAWLQISAIDTSEEQTLSLTTDGPDPSLLSNLIAGPWGWMVSPEGAVQFGDRWRDQPEVFQFSSGTGPFRPVSFASNADVSFARSEDWWGEGAYPDGIIIRRVPTPAIEASYRSGQLDRVDFPLTKNLVDSLREDFPDDPQFEIPLDTPVQLQFAISDDPTQALSDPRVGRALGLALDRFELIERIYLGDGRPSGPLPWFMEGWALPEQDLLTMPGYRPDKEDDLTEIAALIDAAGGPDSIQDIPLVIADLFEGVFGGIGQSVANMIERNTGLAVDTDFLNYGAIREQLAAGTLPAWFGWGPAPRSADPTDYFHRTVHSEGVENFGRYANPDVDALIEDMQSTIEIDERRDQARQIQQLLLDDAFWIQNVTNGIQLGLHRPYLHVPSAALDFAWSGHHLDKLWLDESHADYPTDRVLPEPVARPADPNAPVGPQPSTSDEDADGEETEAAE